MKKKIIAFGASNSKQSINKQFASYAASQIEEASVEVLDLNDYEMPIYSIDREKEEGIPELAHAFKAKIKAADGIIISFAEHNGAYTVAYKNVYDWISRIEKNVWGDKPMWLLATSPGGRGGQFVLAAATQRMQFTNKNEVLSFSLPSFRSNFSSEEGILDADLAQAFQKQLQAYTEAIHSPATVEK